MRYLTLGATRGNIYSDDGNILATSVPSYELAIDPLLDGVDVAFKTKLDTLCILLSGILESTDKNYKSAKDYKIGILRAKREQKRYFKLIDGRLEFQQKKQIEAWPLFKKERMEREPSLARLKRSIIFYKIEDRKYPFSPYGNRTIGRIDRETNPNHGKVGLEYSFDYVLAGKPGYAKHLKTFKNNFRPVFDGTETPSEDGKDIQTTLNTHFQDIVESSLIKAIKEHDADYGLVILMEVKTGHIKAICNIGKMKSGVYKENYNYSIGDQGNTEPGSTFKVLTMMALLELTDIHMHDSIETGNGEYKIYQNILRDSKKGGFGRITIQEAFEKSSNIAMAKLVIQHFGNNPTEFIDFITDIGIDKRVHVQLDGESFPYIKKPSDKNWSGLSLAWMAQGYELKINPLQTLTLYNAIANDGKMISPLIVTGIKNGYTYLEQYTSQVLQKQICSQRTLSILKTLLEGVVERGTAQNIRGTDYKIAGKTGTAKKIEKGKYTNKYYTSFVGYFPADMPKYSCIVVIDNPKNFAIYGSDVAAPVFKEIADNIYSMDINIHKPYILNTNTTHNTFPLIKAGNKKDIETILKAFPIPYKPISEDNTEWIHAHINNNIIGWKAIPITHNLIPNVIGMTIKDALFLLENQKLEVSIQGSLGKRIIMQSLTPNTRISTKKKITITTE
ncbi:MAG: penicillin-binding protein [Chitinophagaceae bacterium]|nr:penicillin-binding protein [Chitinophagaceae bacterium]